MVGHSLGPAFLLDLLEGLDKPVKATFSVAGFLGLLNNQDFDEINKTFTDRDFDWNKIKKNCDNFYVYHSNDDPYLPFEKAIELTEKLNTKVIEVKNAGHFNQAAGYDKFELLLKDIRKNL